MKHFLIHHKRRLILAAGAFSTVSAIGLSFYLDDETVADHSDLEPAAVPSAIPDNGYYELALACSKAYEPGPREIWYLERALEAVPRPAPELIASTVAKNAEAFAHLRRALAADRLVLPQEPWFDTGARAGMEKLAVLDQALHAAVVDALYRGDVEGAIAIAEDGAQLGRRLLTARGTIEDLQHGRWFVDSAVLAANRVTDHVAGSGALVGLERLQAICEPCGVDAEALDHAVRLAFSHFVAYLEHLGDTGGDELDGFGKLQFRRNLTINSAAGYTRSMLAALRDGEALPERLGPPG